MTWRDQAACRNVYDLMFDDSLVSAALTLCGTCPVLNECAAYAAVFQPPEGVWAGVDARALKRTRRRRLHS